MRIQLYKISKNTALSPLCERYIKQCKAFGVQVESKSINSNAISTAQKLGETEAKQEYKKALTPLLLKGANTSNIALHPKGKALDSYAFANLLDSRAKVAFFIGGAFGFDEEFLSLTNPISLSLLTFSHAIVEVILLEQIYRALSILANHPYHK